LPLHPEILKGLSEKTWMGGGAERMTCSPPALPELRATSWPGHTVTRSDGAQLLCQTVVWRLLISQSQKGPQMAHLTRKSMGQDLCGTRGQEHVACLTLELRDRVLCLQTLAPRGHCWVSLDAGHGAKRRGCS
jgi:hypothetical protein